MEVAIHALCQVLLAAELSMLRHGHRQHSFDRSTEASCLRRHFLDLEGNRYRELLVHVVSVNRHIAETGGRLLGRHDLA